ncbi:MAG TPA: transglycosylase SLT domain-containing protein [Ktedonobacterales bacterium]|nr:transglycosylase SLT domain-containing protein [Ktedonobacterales bacterium]
MRGFFSNGRRRFALVGIALCLLALAGTLLMLAPGSNGQTFFEQLFGGSVAQGTNPANQGTNTATPHPNGRIKHLPPLPYFPVRTTQLAALDNCPTPTALPAPTGQAENPTVGPTDTPAPTNTPSANSPTATPTPQIITQSSTSCACPYYKGNNPSQSAIAQALKNAATTYDLPVNLLDAVAWQESRWHEDVLSCDGGIGLMQIQYYTYPWLNQASVPVCEGLEVTNYNPYDLQGNADLGAKLLKYLSCYYSYWGDNGGTSINTPGQYTIAWYYQQAGLQYPDTLNADGSTNTSSLCDAYFHDATRPWYPALKQNDGGYYITWGCPYSATAGDATLLDMTLSAYNEGAGYTDQYGVQNWWYVQGVANWIPQFANGSLPTPS